MTADPKVARAVPSPYSWRCMSVELQDNSSFQLVCRRPFRVPLSSSFQFGSVAMAITSAEHYRHFQNNRHIISASAFVQRRRNLKAAIEVLQYLFLGLPPQIPVGEQDDDVVVTFPSVRTPKHYTSQEAATKLVEELRSILGAIGDEQAADEGWLRSHRTEAYESHRAIEACFKKGSAYSKYVFWPARLTVP